MPSASLPMCASAAFGFAPAADRAPSPNSTASRLGRCSHLARENGRGIERSRTALDTATELCWTLSRQVRDFITGGEKRAMVEYPGSVRRPSDRFSARRYRRIVGLLI